MRIPTSKARDKLSEIIRYVQDPRRYCMLTRHGKPVAAIVSLAELDRIWTDQDIEDISAGEKYPGYFYFGRGGHATTSEAAAAIHQVQLERKIEREVLAKAGKKPLPGGELEIVAQVKPKRRSWFGWLRRKRKVGSGAVAAAGILERVIEVKREGG